MDCIKGTSLILDQINRLLALLTSKEYQEPLPVLNGSSVGQHFRHILDFYLCLCRGVSSGRIDYADRERDLRIEQDPAYAREAFLALEKQIRPFQETDRLVVLADFVPDQDVMRPAVDSSVGRELMYAYDHALHHLAIIKIGLRESFPQIQVDAHVGVAPSTLKYQASKENK